ncbi:hypothetical protein P691DRAFT_786790 [Macrolepiota fuliginosa MF-IS2]|uniref:Uncharacterized protein n=1 Tax=Macrolepiota fuliginosa MF-IS2 TaxID=1400762 RepID=A0A9P5XIM1_9AGAR|nr:hypothetical protein P691DRAFT_786790 [Macrolepiota fuliginosa MF-IS2]
MLPTSASRSITPSSTTSSLFSFFRLFKKEERPTPEFGIPNIVITHVDVSAPQDSLSVSSSFSVIQDSANTIRHRVQGPPPVDDFNARTPFSGDYLVSSSRETINQDLRASSLLATPSRKQVPLRRIWAERLFPSMKSSGSLSKNIALTDYSPSSPSANHASDAIFIVGDDHDDHDTQPTSDTKSMAAADTNTKAVESLSIRYPSESPLQSNNSLPQAPSFSRLQQNWMPSLGYITQTVKKMDLRTKLARFSENLVASFSNKLVELTADTSASAVPEDGEEGDAGMEDVGRPWHEILDDLEREMDPFSRLGV